MVSVVIAQRDEPYLDKTVASIAKACGKTRPEVIVVNDGRQQLQQHLPRWVRVETPWEEPRGCQAARDWGILAAEHPACVVVDAHMDFEPGLFAGYRERLDEHPQDVLCAHTPGLDPVAWKWREHVCSGAFMLWADGGQTALSLKWRYLFDTGDVPAVLGACYGLSREWYIDGLQRPWQYGTGWGCDEETLSIVNWLCGGRNVATPFSAAHWFRSPKDVPHARGSLTLIGHYANRLRLVDMLPMPEPWRAELTSAILRHPMANTMAKQITQTAKRNDCSAMREWLSMQQRTFQEFRHLFCSDANPQGRPELNPPGCRTEPQEGAAPLAAPGYQSVPMAAVTEVKVVRKAPEPNIVVEDPGIRCPKCGSRYGHRVTNTYPNGNRRRVCGSCGKPFVTVRAHDGRPATTTD